MAVGSGPDLHAPGRLRQPGCFRRPVLSFVRVAPSRRQRTQPPVRRLGTCARGQSSPPGRPTELPWVSTISTRNRPRTAASVQPRSRQPHHERRMAHTMPATMPSRLSTAELRAWLGDVSTTTRTSPASVPGPARAGGGGVSALLAARQTGPTGQRQCATQRRSPAQRSEADDHGRVRSRPAPPRPFKPWCCSS